MHFNTPRDIEGLRQAGKIAARVLWDLVNLSKPGTQLLKLDEKAGEIIKKSGAQSAPKLLEKFPANVCISVNEVIAHGVPTQRILRCGDRLNIDVSVEHKGYFGDVAYSVVIGQDHNDLNRLCKVAKDITLNAIELSFPGTKLNAIGNAIEEEARKNGYTVVKNLCSHGIGKKLHAHPANILNYYDPDETLVLEEGMVIAWEPFISDGACRAIESDCDEWSLTTHNQSHVAQYEHTILITNNKPEILTVFN